MGCIPAVITDAGRDPQQMLKSVVEDRAIHVVSTNQAPSLLIMYQVKEVLSRWGKLAGIISTKQSTLTGPIMGHSGTQGSSEGHTEKNSMSPM